MSKKNRKAMYDKLVANDKAGKKPGLSQDDGSLIKEFGAPAPTPTPAPEKRGKK